MNLICAVCSTELKGTGKFCSECGSQKFIEQELKNLLAPGDVLGSRYKIIEFLKTGGMGAVYKAEDLRLSKLCAIKELINTAINSEERKAGFIRFEREAKILSELDHPNLPRVIDYFTLGDRHYLAMDYIDGYDLGSLVKEKDEDSKLKEEDIIKWSLQVCEVLHYLHTRNPPVIYRDLKPSNIMIRQSDDRVMLIDFGIARTVAPVEEESLTKTAIGTIGYMAPEQYKGKSEARSDIYSLGATMHHLLTGKTPLPFSLETLKHVRHDISPQLNAVVMKSLRLKPSERFQSVLDIKKALTGNLQIEMPVTKEVSQVDLLLTQLSSKDPNLRYIILKALDNCSDEEKILIPLINISLKDPDLIVRREAMRLLATLQNKKILEAFNKTVLDNDIEIREISIDTICRFKDKSSREVLIKSLSDKTIALKAALCLIDMRDVAALEEVVKLLKKENSETQVTLEKAINSIDPFYLAEWRKEKAKEEIKSSGKKEKRFFIYMAILLVILAVITKVYIDYSRERSYKKTMEEGFTFIDNFDTDSAIDSFNKALNIKGESHEIYYWLGESYLYKDTVKARYYLNKAMSLKKDYPEALISSGKLYIIENNFKEAINYLEKSIKLNSNLPLAYIYEGEAFYKSGDKARAKTVFKLASSWKDEHIASSAKGWLRKIDGEKPEIEQKIQISLEKAKTFIEQIDYISAGQAYQDIITTNPDDDRGYFGMGQIHSLKKNDSLAINYFNKAIECNPMNIKAMYNIAYIYINSNDYNQAHKYIFMAQQADPSDPDIHYLLGILYDKKGKKEQALKELNLYLNLNPSGKYAGESGKIIERINRE
jgi:serine/threonine protein kinase/Flp pilus assembly protein TadD